MPYQKKKLHLLYPKEFKFPYNKIFFDNSYFPTIDVLLHNNKKRVYIRTDKILKAIKFNGSVIFNTYIGYRNRELIKKGLLKRDHKEIVFENGMPVESIIRKYIRPRKNKDEANLPEKI